MQCYSLCDFTKQLNR